MVPEAASLAEEIASALGALASHAFYNDLHQLNDNMKGKQVSGD